MASQSKAMFIRGLQDIDAPLNASEIVQLIRKEYSWISLHKGDNSLNAEAFRGYMVKPELDSAITYTPDRPAVYWCVMSLNQSLGWQNVIWIKEILQIIDSGNHCTNDRASLEAMLEMRVARSPNNKTTRPNVVADKNGFVLALGCAVPRKYRAMLKATGALGRFGEDNLAELLNVPVEYVDVILSENFEEDFSKALSEIEG